jgi:hypothetical protein
MGKHDEPNPNPYEGDGHKPGQPPPESDPGKHGKK